MKPFSCGIGAWVKVRFRSANHDAGYRACGAWRAADGSFVALCVEDGGIPLYVLLDSCGDNVGEIISVSELTALTPLTAVEELPPDRVVSRLWLDRFCGRYSPELSLELTPRRYMDYWQANTN